MYLPSLFREDRPDVLAGLMRDYPLATLVTLGKSGLIASHIPLIYEPIADSPGVLHGHVARVNTQWQDARTDGEALAIFQGPEAYVSPTWYATKVETGRVVPTWNYAVVHAYGTLETYSEPERLRSHLELLTATHEASFSLPWTVNDAPKTYIDSMIAAIVGIDFHITRLEGKWKVSQNRPAEDREGVVRGLRNQGEPRKLAIADLVCEHAPKPRP
jgi:transcriptional regulator